MQSAGAGNMDKQDHRGNTPLHDAAFAGQSDTVRTLLKTGSSSNQRNLEGETPLHLAAEGKHKDVVKILLDSGADPALQDNNGATPCLVAASTGAMEVMELLTRKEVELSPNRVRVYYDPVESSHPHELLGTLSIRDKDSSKNESSELDGSDRVLTERSTTTKEDNVIPTQVKKTKRGGRKHKKKTNEQENIPVQTIRPDKITDLYLRVMTMFPNDIEDKLRDYFFEGRFDEINCSVIDTKRTDRAGLTILHHAVRCCRFLAVERLVVKCKADVNSETFRGVTPIFLAATTGYSDVIRILHENGANINHTLKCGMTPLHYAVVHKSVNAVLTLIYLGAEVNCPDNNGNTPLHYGAMTNNNLKVVITLVEKGAEVQYRNVDGFRPLEIAKRGCDVAITQYLAKLTANIPLEEFFL